MRALRPCEATDARERRGVRPQDDDVRAVTAHNSPPSSRPPLFSRALLVAYPAKREVEQVRLSPHPIGHRAPGF